MLIWRNIQARKTVYLDLLVGEKTVCVFDSETTGVEERDKIIQFSAQRYRIKDFKLSYIDSMDTYINPQMPILPKITKINGINDEMVKDKPNERECIDGILGYLYSADVWAGYNIPFDIRMVKQMCNRCHVPLNERGSIDVLEMARDFVDQNIVEKYELSRITDFIFPEEDYSFHNSMEDVKATACLLEYFIPKYLEYEEDSKRTTPVHLEKASTFINPKKGSQQRIRLQLAGGYDLGAIYYDAVKKVWSCKSDTASKRLFKTCDMVDLERQFMEKYGYRFGHNTVDEVAKAWFKYKREQKKENNAEKK